jgi:hypothetical protein
VLVAVVPPGVVRVAELVVLAILRLPVRLQAAAYLVPQLLPAVVVVLAVAPKALLAPVIGLLVSDFQELPERLGRHFQLARREEQAPPAPPARPMVSLLAVPLHRPLPATVSVFGSFFQRNTAHSIE